MQAVGPAHRKVLGSAADYVADSRLPRDLAEELSTDFVQRRKFAWSVVSRAIRPVAVGPDRQPSSSSIYVPAWLTWYSADEIKKIFTLYLAEVHRLQGDGTCAFDATVCAPQRLATWAMQVYAEQRDIEAPAQAYYDRLAALLITANNARAAGALAAGVAKGDLSGVVTLYNKEVVSHYLQNYEAVIDCLDAPFLAPSTSDSIEDETPDWIGSCFNRQNQQGEFPAAAVVIKARWQRLSVDSKLRVFATDAGTLSSLLHAGQTSVQQSWRLTPGQFVDSGGQDSGWPRLMQTDRAFVVRTLAGGEQYDYMLTGLHIATKETPRWVWVSLWWDHEPRRDFGSDRPESLCASASEAECVHSASMLEQFKNYKMCVVTDFKERDPRFQRSQANFAEHQELADLMRALHQHTDGHTWCSNPYHEQGVGELKSNCMGCHQFASPQPIFTRPEALTPDKASIYNVLGRRLDRFPTDFLWTFSQPGEELAAKLRDAYQSL